MKFSWFNAARYAAAGLIGLILGYLAGLALSALCIVLSLVLGKTLAVCICIPLAIVIGYFDASYTIVLINTVDNCLVRWYKAWTARRAQSQVIDYKGLSHVAA